MREAVLNRIKVEIKKAYYAHTRYKVDTVFGLMYHEKSITVQELSKYLRISDYFIELDEKHYFIIFAHTQQEGVFKAAENLLYNLDNYFNDRSTYIALDTFDVTNSHTIVINRLMEILKETKKNQLTRIEDENILNENI
ncbi:hypothetical protein KJ877_01675 [bacterium]|nr:hypothetical protein [bacterium]MBU1989973.1 hypothetical protein [bacterium]